MAGAEGEAELKPEEHGEEPPQEPAKESADAGSEADESEEVEEEEDEDEKVNVRRKLDRALLKRLAERLEEEPLSIRVHDITIKGNKKTKDWVIEAVLDKLKNAKTMQEVLQEAAKANAQMQRMGVFDRCIIKLDAGPEELPGTTNVIVEVEEAQRPFSCDVGVYSKPETRNWTLEGALKWKNLLGYGETWDGTGCYGWDSTSETSVGAHFPRFRTWPAALVARASMLTQDWHKYSSYKERLLGVSAGLVTYENHELSYNLTWRNLMDPSHRASKAVRSQLGHALLSSVKYTFKDDKRDSVFRPTQGYAFATTFQIAGLGPDSRLLRFIRQEIDFRFAVPLGVFKSALNFGASAGFIIPWGKDIMNKSTPISDRFFMGGHSSLVGDLRGPSSLLGFRTRGVGPSELRRQVKSGDEAAVVGRDTLGGDFAVNGFVDLSFDLPVKFLKDHDIHAHTFICAGNVVSLTDRSPITARGFLSTFRCSTGVGLVIPTRLFRLEINFCRILRHQEHDRVKRGFQFSFSSPS